MRREAVCAGSSRYTDAVRCGINIAHPMLCAPLKGRSKDRPPLPSNLGRPVPGHSIMVEQRAKPIAVVEPLRKMNLEEWHVAPNGVGP